MEKYIAALKKIVPKELQILRRRYKVLKGIQLFQPIGRRALADKIDITEKMIRTETEFLKREGCIKSTGAGMALELKGQHLIDDLKPFIDMMDGTRSIEEKIREILNCKEVFVVSGNADEDEEAKLNIGYKAAEVLLKTIEDGDIIALTGGSTMHQVVEAIGVNDFGQRNISVVPARGSLGRNVAYQSNTLAAMLAAKLNSRYNLLNIPDNLSQRSLESVREEPEIQAALDKLVKANILVYGIGNAIKMAKRRNLPEEEIAALVNNKATAEALGYYFNKEGEVIYTSRSIGITIDQMTELKNSIAVAGGYSKSDAILSVGMVLKDCCVIMDEGAAKGIIEKARKRCQKDNG